MEGSLLPLWTFQHEETADLEVTGVCWNLRYTDLFGELNTTTTKMWVVACSSTSGVSYGSYNFYEQRRAGYVCCYSLKNPSHPEFVLRSQAGVAFVLAAVCDPITQKMLHFREPLLKLSPFAYQAFKHNT